MARCRCSSRRRFSTKLLTRPTSDEHVLGQRMDLPRHPPVGGRIGPSPNAPRRLPMRVIKKVSSKETENSVTEPVRPQPEPESVSKPIQVKEISSVDLRTRLNHDDDLIVVDMRQAWEYQSGHIPGAIHMFIQEIPMRFNELSKECDIVFQCWHGNTSLRASRFLIEKGWDALRVSSLSGGIAGWTSAFGQDGLVKH